MKKACVALFFMLGFLCACNASSAPDVLTTEAAAATNLEWPAFLPEDIRLTPDEEYISHGYPVPRYRAIYYAVPGWFLQLAASAEPDAINDWVDRKYKFVSPEALDEMPIAAAIKHFNIARADFEKAQEESARSTLETGSYNCQPNDEIAERYNPDIIYTFDNEIINAYYRRENPVVPD